MSILSSVNCPVCGKKDAMMEDWFYKQGEVFYHCHTCGYGNLFREIEEDGEKFWKWDKQDENLEFVKIARVKKEQGLMFYGDGIPFYPIEAEFAEYSVYPESKKGKLIWRLYSPDEQLRGEFASLGEAFVAGDKYADSD
jgi:hypothetical protein